MHQDCSGFSSGLTARLPGERSPVRGPARASPTDAAAPGPPAGHTREFYTSHAWLWSHQVLGRFVALGQCWRGWPSLILQQMPLPKCFSEPLLAEFFCSSKYPSYSEQHRNGSVFWAAHFSLEAERKIMVKIQWALGNSTWKQLFNSLTDGELKLHTYLSLARYPSSPEHHQKWLSYSR